MVATSIITSILYTLAAPVVATALTLLAATALSRYFRFSLEDEHIVALGVFTALFGGLFAVSPPSALFVWATATNVAIAVFVLAATRRYLEDHPKGGQANHRTRKK